MSNTEYGVPKVGCCENCLFWDTSSSHRDMEDGGRCVRKAPKIDITGIGIWPYTDARDRCGEYAARRRAEGAE